jgi:APA family basic amino acid/polyamine antiporter
MEGKGYAARLTLADAVLLVVGSVIGGGIYMNAPRVAALSGTPALALCVWFAGGLVSLAGAFCFAELGSRFPRAGGSYVYLREAFGRAVAFLQGWSILMVSGSGSIAAIALFCGFTIKSATGLPVDSAVIAIAAIASLTVVNCLGVRPGATVQDIFTVLKVGVLLAVVAGAAVASAPTSSPAAAPAADQGTFLALLSALGPALFAYGGWQVTNCMAAEIEDAPRRLPRALVAGIGIVIAVYLIVNVAYIHALTLPGLAASKAPANEVMQRVAGGGGLKLLEIGIVFSTLGFLSAVILALPRMYQAMAEDGATVGFLAHLHPTYRTPVRAIVLQGIWASVLCVSGQVDQLMEFVVFGDWTFMALTGLALIAVRRRGDPAPAYAAPGGNALPAFFAAVSFGVLIGAIHGSPSNSLKAAGLILLGLPLFALTSRGRSPAP